MNVATGSQEEPRHGYYGGRAEIFSRTRATARWPSVRRDVFHVRIGRRTYRDAVAAASLLEQIRFFPKLVMGSMFGKFGSPPFPLECWDINSAFPPMKLGCQKHEDCRQDQKLGLACLRDQKLVLETSFELPKVYKLTDASVTESESQ